MSPAAAHTDRDNDNDVSDDYVQRMLSKPPDRPPLTLRTALPNIQAISTLVLLLTPVLAVYGAATTPLARPTAAWAAVYYFLTELGITAGYHRLWAHRAYRAHPALQLLLALLGAGAVQGSIRWWARGHRAHHRYTDTDLDPYGAHHGLLWSHLGWMIFKPARRPGSADTSDLRANRIVRWQHAWYVPLLLTMGFAFPAAVAGLGWADWRGGLVYAGLLRLVCVHHSTFCVNSLAHWLGEATFDNRITPRDHFVTALVTAGEGYHNFHHQFPMDYRNATRWYQYDPTKWFIRTMSMLGLASHLHVFPENEVRKGRLAMQLRALHAESRHITWPTAAEQLPVLSWADFTRQSTLRPLIVVSGFIHDVGAFVEQHPGGAQLLRSRIGCDATTAFGGGVYDHSNAAHNLLAMMRVGVLEGGYRLAKDALGGGIDTVRGGADSDEVEVEYMLGRPTPGTRPSASPARAIDPAARRYVTPGQSYRIVQDGVLMENSTARQHGGRVGNLLWARSTGPRVPPVPVAAS